jgi:CRISPR system Cascade subunit CasA
MAKRKSAKTDRKESEEDLCRHSREQFNLIDEHWIPVVWKPEAQGLSGHTGAHARPPELGLRDTLLYAHEITEVTDQSPLVTAALHRLMIALVHAIYRGPEKRRDWVEMWEAEIFDATKVHGYFKQWRHRFWLFHPERPFLQWPDDDLGNPVSVTLLNMALASTGDATLFDHSLDSLRPGFTCAEAVRQLTAFLTFKTGGFVEGVPGARTEASALAAPWADGAAFLSQRENLFETLTMNLTLHDSRNGTVSELGMPEWERDTASPWTPPQQGVTAGPPQSYLALLTSPCRRVRLSEPDSLMLVRNVRLQLGTVFIADRVDPAKAYYADKKKGWRPLALRADRALWRNSTTLLQLLSNEHAPPASLAQLSYLRALGIFPADFTVGLRAFGTIGSQAKIDLWRAETLPIPISVLGNNERRVLIEDCLSLAEDVGKGLGSAARVLASHLVARSKEEKDRNALRDSLDITRPFWTDLEIPFKRDVLGSPVSVDVEDVRRQWATRCMALARDVLVKTVNGLSSGGRTFRAGAEAERTLSSRLQKVREEHNLN